MTQFWSNFDPLWDFLVKIARQHFRLSICFDFYWAWQILRRLRWPPVSGCGIFDGPQLSEKCLKVAVFGGLAVPHIWNHYWVGFWGHIYITVELGRTFLSLLLTSDSSNLGRVGFVQIGAKLDLFELEMIFLLHPTSSHPTYKPYIFWKILVQGYQIRYYQVSHTQIHKYKYTNTQIQHITKCQKDPTCGIFMKSGLIRGIKNYSRISSESRIVVQGMD